MPDRLILSGATLIDGTGAPPVPGRAVVVERDRVVDVVGASRTPAGDVLRLDGLTLLPGLVNCHVHLCLGAEADPVRPLVDDPAGLTALKMAARARQSVEAGVTTVRDLGGKDYLELAVKRAIAERLIPGPRVLAAGRGICMTGGHGWWFGREADGPDDVRKAVREQLKMGVDVIKIFATGGVMTPGVEPGSSQLTEAEIRAAIEEAGKAGRRVAAHAQATAGIRCCVEAGITTIEHGVFLDADLVARMKRDGVFLVPTLVASRAIAEGGEAAGIPAFMARKARGIVETHGRSFEMAARAGVPIAAGSDAGTPLNPHGSLVPELALMIRHGLPPMEALRAATSQAAAALGLEREIGRVAPGFAADLLAVEGDPLADIGALSRVRLVIAHGEPVVNRLGATAA
ncbi:MAG: amidohydrolase family protein [Candidatus Rokubacteria bacterium]|nr:amidohydrolase family protein [Candidatus Rokubacteria bacterium]